MAHWTRSVDLRRHIENAAEDDAKIPALLTEMATAVEPDSPEFAEELREAADAIADSDTPRDDADYWLAQLYEWADAARIWIA